MYNLDIPIADYWMFIDNSQPLFKVIADGQKNVENIKNKLIWTDL